MSRNSQIGWGPQEKLLYDITKQLDRLIKLMGTIANSVTTTTTTTTV